MAGKCLSAGLILTPLFLSILEGQRMSETYKIIERLIAECTAEERKALKLHLCRVLPHPLEDRWGIDADTILNAIDRASDLTKRGIRGIIAEAVFVNDVLPTVLESGWVSTQIAGDYPYDALLSRGSHFARIQVKLQRTEKGIPKLYYPNRYPDMKLFVVEVQKTRSGEKATTRTENSDKSDSRTQVVKTKTRPYTFNDFDLLAVSMHPSTGNWHSFRYTVASWLLPRPKNPELIEVFQPVSEGTDETWTEDLNTCLDWLVSGQYQSVLPNIQRK